MLHANPLITTIIPTYRRPRLLQRAIQSVLRQTYPHFHVCVYDNASCDETASIVAEIAKIDRRVHYYHHVENIGMVDNFIYGMEHVETPFFSFLPDDDVYLPHFFETAMHGLEQFPDAMFSAGSTIQITDTGKIAAVCLSSWKREGYYVPLDGLSEMIQRLDLVLIGAVFRQEVIERVGVFDREVGSVGDLHFLLRIMARFPFVISKRPCALWVSHRLSYSVSADLHSIWQDLHKMILNLVRDDRIPLDIRILANEMLSEQLRRRLFKYGLHCIVQKNYEDACKVAEILDDQFHAAARSSTIHSVARLCQHFPLAPRVVNGLNTLRKRFRKNTLLDRSADPNGSIYSTYLQPGRYAGGDAHVDYGIPS